MGSRVVAVLIKTSYIKVNPCEEVAVNVLPPAADAPLRMLKAECSPSGVTNSASIV
jgi:hypothetical protein